MDDHEMELLFRSAQAGDPSALDQLLEKCRPQLLLWAEWGGMSRLQLSDAEDCVQETLRCVADRLSQSEWRGLEAFQGWLRRFLFRQITDWRRKQTRARRDVRRQTSLSNDHSEATAPGSWLQLADSVGTPVDEVIRQELEDRLSQVVHELPLQQQQIIRLHYQEGLALDEVAPRLQLAYGTVRNLHSQALRTLRLNLTAPSQLPGDRFSRRQSP